MIIQQHFGPHAVWTLTGQISRSTASFSTFVTSDVIYCATNRDCKTVFDIRADILQQGSDPGLRIHFGIPAMVLVALARMANVCADSQRDRLKDEQEAASIEHILQAWVPETRAGCTTSALMGMVAVQCMWREVNRCL